MKRSLLSGMIVNEKKRLLCSRKNNEKKIKNAANKLSEVKYEGSTKKANTCQVGSSVACCVRRPRWPPGIGSARGLLAASGSGSRTPGCCRTARGRARTHSACRARAPGIVRCSGRLRSGHDTRLLICIVQYCTVLLFFFLTK